MMVSPTSVSRLDNGNDAPNSYIAEDSKSLSSNPPPQPTSGGRRTKFRPKITVDTSSMGRSLYFPCGKPPPTQPPATPDIESDSSSSPYMSDDLMFAEDAITLTNTGFVDDVVTPFLPPLPESSWSCIARENERSQKSVTPPPGPIPRSVRRVSFSDENKAPLVILRPSSGELEDMLSSC